MPRRKRRYRNSGMVDPTPEEIAAWKSKQPIKTHGHDEVNPDANHARFYAWLYDADNVTPLAVAVQEVR